MDAVKHMQQDIAKVKEVLLIKHSLVSISTDSIRDNLSRGQNRSCKTIMKGVKCLNYLYNYI